jgi:1-phosphofructokinase
MSTGTILCVTPNPALDRTLEVAGLRPGAILRTSPARVVAGGKGVNVARALRALGVSARCAGPLGGASGRMLADLAAGEGLEAAWTWCEIETRSCLILVDPAARQATVINEAGPHVPPGDWSRVCDDVLAQAASAREVSVSGSLPPGVPADGLAALCRSLAQAGHAPWVDSSGPALGAVLSGPVEGMRLKINREEAEETLGQSLLDVAASVAAARRLLGRGMSAVVLTLGADGAVLAAAGGCWHAAAPPVESASSVASGDAFLAGLMAASIAGRDLAEALRWGVAAGAANALSGGGARFSREQFDSVLSRVHTRDLA